MSSGPAGRGGPGRRSAGRGGWRPQVELVAVLVAAGALLATIWRTLAPYSARLGDQAESAAAVDSTLAVLGLLFGAATAGFVLLWPGRSPGLRTLAAIGGSALGAALSWQLGDLLGTPALRAVGAAFAWPVATSLGLFLGALLPFTSSRLNAGVPAEEVREISPGG